MDADIARLIDEVRDDQTHGAIELARQALGVMRTGAENSQAATSKQLIADLGEIGQALISVRPSMAPIRNVINRLLGEVSAKSARGEVDLLREFTVNRVAELINESQNAVVRIIANARELIVVGDIIMTHSYSSTVAALLEESASQLAKIEIVVTRSGAGRTGEAIARRLGGSGLIVTFIDDTAVGSCMPTVNKVLLGADTISAAGVVNGIGSYQVAVLAARHEIPVYVLADTLKFDSSQGQREFDTEERDAAELAAPAGMPQTVTIRNPHFDITPLGLFTGVVTERGIMTPDDVITLLNT